MIRFTISAIAALCACSSAALATISALPDVSGDNIPDIASRANVTTPNTVDVLSGADASIVRSINFFSASWTIIDHATLPDGDGDNIADDPAIVALARNNTNGRIRVQVRYALDGSNVRGSFDFFDNGITPPSAWTPLAVGIVNDPNGDGNTADRAVATMAQKGTEKPTVELRQVSDASQIGKWGFFGSDWTGIAVAGVNPSGGIPTVAVLARNPNGTTRLQQRRIDNGDRSTLFVSGNEVVATDMDVLDDLDNNGTTDDPGFVVLGKKASNNTNRYRILRASDGSKLGDQHVINASWTATDVAVIDDTSGNSTPEIAAYSEQGIVASIKLRDVSTGSTVDTFTVETGQISIAGAWAEASGAADVLGIAFFDDGTYVHTEYIAGESEDWGMEWGTYTRDPVTGQIVAGQVFDSNSDLGLSDFTSESVAPFIYVNEAGADLAVTIDEDGDGNIDETLTFVLEPQNGLIGTWENTETENELLMFHFTSEGTYIHAEYDDNPGIEINGMEWGTWSQNIATGELTVTLLFDENGDTGLTDFANTSARIFASVNGDVLTLSFDEDGNGSIDGTLDFNRTF